MVDTKKRRLEKKRRFMAGFKCACRVKMANLALVLNVIRMPGTHQKLSETYRTVRYPHMKNIRNYR